MTQMSGNALKVTTPNDLEIVMTREFAAPRQLVWDAFTKPEHVARWLGFRDSTVPVCEIDLRVGGSWRYLLRGADGMELALYGEFIEISPPERLVQTENFEGEFFEVMGAGTLNTLVLEAHGNKTHMTLTALYKSKEARDGALETGMEGGAAISFDRLEELLAEMQA